MKYEVKMSCGHESTIELFGKNEERERKIKYLEAHGVCPHCQAAEKKTELGSVEEIEMHYSEYKNNYAECKTVPGSYDKKNKTIVVYVPVKIKEVASESELAKAPEKAPTQKQIVIEEIINAKQEAIKEIENSPASENVIKRLEETVDDMQMVKDFDFEFFKISTGKKFLSIYFTMLDRKFTARDDFSRGIWRILDKHCK